MDWLLGAGNKHWIGIGREPVTNVDRPCIEWTVVCHFGDIQILLAETPCSEANKQPALKSSVLNPSSG